MAITRDVVAELAYPARTTTALFALLTFFLLIELALFAGLLGLLLLLLVVPAVSRYLMQLLEARAHGRHIDPPDIALFSFFSGVWSLFPLLLITVAVGLGYVAASHVGVAAAIAVAVVAIAVLPASLGVLAMTHAPLQCVDPRRMLTLIRRCGGSYWLLPLTAGSGSFATALLAEIGTPDSLVRLAAWYATFALFALIGAVLRANALADDITILHPAAPAPLERDDVIVRQRRNVLTHAYGFVSRGNRRGGLLHIFAWLDEDPEPDAAWSWFFWQMTNWEDPTAGLEYAQHLVSRLLRDGDQIAAVKILLRCCDIEPRFKPWPDDRDLAVRAAESCDNEELAALLRS